MRLVTCVGIALVLAALLPAACGDARAPSDRPTNDEPVGGETVFCTDPQPPFVTDLRVRQEQPVAEPAPRAAFRDAVYGGCVVRVSDRAADPDPDDASAGIKNEYSRLQSFNADGARIMLMSLGAHRYLYDAATLQRLGALPAMNDPRWSNVDPNTIYYIGELTLMAFDVATGEHRLVHDFAPGFAGEDVVMVWTRWEGNPSADDRYWALMAEDADWMTTAFLVYDLLEDRVVARRTVSPPGDVDNVTMSPLGGYFLAQFEYCEHGTMGSAAAPCGLMVYDRDLGNPRGLLRNVGHADVALDADGREVLFYQDQDTDHVAVLDLQDGTITNLHPIDFSYCDGCGMHFSSIAHALPGWGLVSYFDADPITRMWMDDHVFAVELKAGGRVVRFAQHHALVDPEQEHDYWAEPHASVNRDFTRILFTSNWGRSGSGEVDTYMIVLPDGWAGEVP
ncbi:MAG: hypothetical protein K0A98_01940 [Trueperaceae bacterium]|nr:hypothetical protein [Trueperaceae bacterium]